MKNITSRRTLVARAQRPYFGVAHHHPRHTKGILGTNSIYTIKSKLQLFYNRTVFRPPAQRILEESHQAGNHPVYMDEPTELLDNLEVHIYDSKSNPNSFF